MLRNFGWSSLAGCVLLAACASVAARQSGSTGGAVGAASSGSSVGAGAPTAPPVPKPQALADGSFRDLQGNRLVPPAAMFGAKIETCPPLVAKHLALDPKTCSLLAEVMPGLPAAKAGLEPHDIIVAVSGLADANEHTLRKAIRDAKPGDTVVVTVRRGSETKQVSVTLEPWHPDHMVRPLRPEHFQALPPLMPPVPATAAQVQALEQRVAALEKELAELRQAVAARK